MEYKIRPATAADAAAAAGIYAPYIGTTVTFESPAPDEAEMARRIEEVTAFYPWLVCERSGEVIGYSYAHRFRTRAAFDWAVELSVYLSPAAKGRGIGDGPVHGRYRHSAPSGLRECHRRCRHS